MPSLKVIDGDFTEVSYMLGSLLVATKDAKQGWLGPKPEVAKGFKATIIDENNYKSVGGTLGWAVAGGLLTGGLGLIAGFVLGGNKKKRILIIETEDGKSGIVETDVSTAHILQSKSKKDN